MMCNKGAGSYASITLWLLCFQFFSSLSHASQANGFICSFDLAEGNESLRSITLTADVYACMVEKGIENIVIVNGDNQPVPYVSRNPRTSEASVFQKKLPFYQEPELTSFKTKDQIRRISQLTGIASGRDTATAWESKNTSYDALLLDLPKKNYQFLQEIIIEVAHTSPAMTATVVVESSNDLTTWVAVSAPQKIAFLNNGEEQLQRGNVKIKHYQYAKYLRVALLSNVVDFVDNITQIVGVYNKDVLLSPEIQWARASLTPMNVGSGKSDVTEWRATLSGVFPVTHIRMTPTNGIVYYQGTLYSGKSSTLLSDPNESLRREGKKKLKNLIKKAVHPTASQSVSTQWRYVNRFTQYHLQMSDSVSVSSDIVFPRVNSQDWKFVFTQQSFIQSQQLPLVDFGWEADQFQFLAQGKGPFRLLVGSELVSKRIKFPVSLLSDDAMPEKITLIQTPDLTLALDVATENHSKSELGAAWTNVFLWCVLLVGTLLMGFMVYQLMYKMKKDKG